MDWQRIATAPRDGTHVWACGGHEGIQYECWWTHDQGGCWMDLWDSDPEPTHWMKLPKLPATGT